MIKKDKKNQLLESFACMDDAAQSSLLDYAAWLAERSEPREVDVPEPVVIEGPEGESVIKAIKRLAASYPMLDRGKMLHETSGLMTQHVMQGKPADEVINDLEILFARHYQKLIADPS